MLPSLSLRYAHDSCLIVASAPLTLLRIAIPNPAGLVEVLHIVFVPSAAQAKAAAIRRCGRSQALPYANELPQLLPGVRGLTTPFRSDGQTTLPCLQCRLLAPLQSVVRSLATSPPQCFVVINSHTRRSRSPVTHPKTPVDSTPRPIPAAAPRKEAFEVPEPVEGP